jgi:tetratricopeptide (TPR) repeat protein
MTKETKKTLPAAKAKSIRIETDTKGKETPETIELLAVDLYPTNPRKALGLLRKASEYFEKIGDSKKSREALNKAATLVADEGWERRKEGDLAKAQDKAQKALEVYPAHVDAKNLQGLIYLDRLEFAQAHDVFKKAIEDAIAEQAGVIQLIKVSYWNDPDTRPYMRGRHGLAFCLSYQGKHKDALDQFLILLKIDPHDNMGVSFLLGDLYHYIGDFEKAETFYKQYLSQQRASFGYALLLYRLKREQEARIILKKASNASLRTRSMLEDYLHCFVLWEVMGSYAWGQYPVQELHINALTTSLNKAARSIDDEKAYAQTSEAYNFCKLCGPLWLTLPDSYEFLKEGRPGG